MGLKDSSDDDNELRKLRRVLAARNEQYTVLLKRLDSLENLLENANDMHSAKLAQIQQENEGRREHKNEVCGERQAAMQVRIGHLARLLADSADKAQPIGADTCRAGQEAEGARCGNRPAACRLGRTSTTCKRGGLEILSASALDGVRHV